MKKEYNFKTLDKIAEFLVFMDDWYENMGIERPPNLEVETIKLFTEEGASVTFGDKQATIFRLDKRRR